ncbi:GNAT family N-acetyltransferase [Dyadobacter sp. Leaf189]|uniref:GNAT family N-acetyltransferase n=1 Tax=Dyadobacter sp. Leaf189 TaxID=1736295 RepID=UPI00070185FA|nr:GNAT family N-acetyltransferase [Dyadobacter sp. Leaf189]KQS27890.1 GCN5 family acetyltransferase [Dyadobacter sp. Leaf189]
MEILPLSEKDYHSIISVWEASVRATHHFLSEADIQFYKPLILKEYLPSVSLFGIYKEPETLAGFIGIAGDEIGMLFIHPDDFGKGLGKSLCHFAIRELGISKVDVNEDNPGAFEFYKKMGFGIAGRSATDPSGNPFPILHLRLGSGC